MLPKINKEILLRYKRILLTLREIQQLEILRKQRQILYKIKIIIKLLLRRVRLEINKEILLNNKHKL